MLPDSTKLLENVFSNLRFTLSESKVENRVVAFSCDLWRLVYGPFDGVFFMSAVELRSNPTCFILSWVFSLVLCAPCLSFFSAELWGT